MSDPPKSVPTFSFNTAATSGGSSNLFSQPSSTNSKPGISFGSSGNPSSTSTLNLFGSNTAAAPTNSLFGANPDNSAQFGVGQQASGGSKIFGAGGKSVLSVFSFGPGLTGNVPNTGSSSGFAGFSTPNKPTESSGGSQGTGLFGAAASTGIGALFGNAGSSAPSGQVNATPASKSSTGFSFGSTTPAGPPPPSNAGAGPSTGSIFKLNNPQPGNATNSSGFGNLGATAQKSSGAAALGSSFGGFPQTSGGHFGVSKSQEPTAMTSSAQPPSGSFGLSKPPDSNAVTSSTQSTSNLFGANKPAALNPTNTSVQPAGGLFGASQSNNASNLFGNQKAPQAGGSMPGNQNNPQAGSNDNAQGDAAKPSLFPPSSDQSSGAIPSLASASAKTNPPFSFPLPGSQPGGGNAAATPTTAPPNSSLFGQTASSGPSATASAAPSTSTFTSGLFSGLGNEKDKTPATIGPNTGTSAPSISAPAPSLSLFGDLGKPSAPTGASQPITQTPAASTSTDKVTSNANLGASTSGPPPTAQSRLKNKSMDEIITRWASDLSKYQKEFQKQAERVAAWDRTLVENSEKIQKLYGSTLEAERATTEVERQLTAVENDQSEIETWLGYYEQELDRLAPEQAGRGEILQGPDHEREET